MGESRFQFDVFISYSHKNRGWVWEELLQRLEGAGLKVAIDDRDFEIGLPSVKNMVTAVEQSQNIVAVLTPEWVDSQWASFEATLSTTLASPQRRFWPIMLAPCKPPSELAMLTHVDFTDPSKRVEGMAKLLAQLGVSQQRLHESAARSASAGLGALVELMRAPEARDACGDFQENLQETLEQIDLLNRYKRLHDLFQHAENAYELVYRQKAILADDATCWARLALDIENLNAKVQSLRDFAQDAFPESETLWCKKIEMCIERLSRAGDQQSLPLLNSALLHFHQVNGQIPNQLNARLVQSADQLPLPKLIERLMTVDERLGLLSLNQDAATRVKAFRDGVEAMQMLDLIRRVFVDHHNRLQQIDNERRLYDVSKSDAAEQITDGWPILKEMIDGLFEDDPTSGPPPKWVAQLQPIYNALNECCFVTPDGASVSAQRIPLLFARLCGVITLGFNQVDADLLRFCGQLSKIGDEVRRLLGSMRNGDH